MTENELFDEAMSAILKADPKIVREQMEQDAKDRAEARRIKRASSDRDPDDPV